MRFDEVELEPTPIAMAEEAVSQPEERSDDAPRGKRLLALLTDLSLFAALTLALSPLLPRPWGWMHGTALAGFVIVLSYYYFVVSWLLWGKTIGGTIFDVRVIPSSGRAISLRAASIRWATVYLSITSCGIGFLLAALPSRLSLPDRVSSTRCVVG